MRTRHRRADLLLCGALLLGVVAPLSGCSGSDGAAPVGVAASAASTGAAGSGAAVTRASSASSSTTAGTAVHPASPGTSPAATHAQKAPSPTAPAATSTRPVTAPPVAVGRLVPSCHPTQFAQYAGAARGALDTYLFAPYLGGRMRGSGTAAAIALLHGGQAVRFGTQQLVAARNLLATCPQSAEGVVRALDAQVAALRALWPVFAANRAPDAAGVAWASAAQRATSGAASAARMPLAAVVPTVVQIQAA